MANERKTGILVVTHGSRQREANWFMFPIVRELRRRFGNDCIIPCFMELGQPDIPTAIGKLLARGCNHLFVYPFFLVPGRHLQKDIPTIIRETLKDRPEISFEMGEPLMQNPGLTDLVEQRLGQLIPPGKELA